MRGSQDHYRSNLRPSRAYRKSILLFNHITSPGVYEKNLERGMDNIRSLELFSLLNAKNKAMDNGR